MENLEVKNISLDDLVILENLSVRATNVCKSKNLYTLIDILRYYEINKSFLRINFCGMLTEKMLVDLCKKYIDIDPLFLQSYNKNKLKVDKIYSLKSSENIILEMKNLEITNISLDDLVIIENLSVRATNVCKSRDLNTLIDILEYYDNYNSFMNINFCGPLTEKMLVDLCKKYIDIDPQLIRTDKILKLSFDMFNLLNSSQKKMLNNHFKFLVANLTELSFLGIGKISKTNNMNEVFDTIFQKYFKFQNIKGIGKITSKELEVFKKNLIKCYHLIINQPTENFNLDYLKLIIRNTFDYMQISNQNQISCILNGTIRFNLFSFINLLITNDDLYSEKLKDSFLIEFTNVDRQIYNRKSISSKHGKNYDYFRNLKSDLKSRIKNYFSFVLNFDFDFYENYNIDKNQNYHIIDQKVADEINEREGVNFKLEFYSLIIGIFFEDTHILLNDNYRIFDKSEFTRNKLQQQYYIISKSLYNSFNFEEFIKKLNILINEKHSKPFAINFDEFLVNFFNSDNFFLKDDIVSLCKIIIKDLFDLEINDDRIITIKKNSTYLMSELYYDILEENGNWMTAKEIVIKAIEKNPYFNSKEISIGGIMSANKDLFIFFGRSRTYGLRKWETTKSNVRGGTIGNIVEEFLLNENEPKHINDILNYLIKYRPDTNIRSVLLNLEVDVIKRFEFFEDGIIGLVNKEYSTRFIERIKNYSTRIYSYTDYQKIVSNKDNKGHFFKNLEHVIESNHFFSHIQRKIFYAYYSDKLKQSFTRKSLAEYCDCTTEYLSKLYKNKNYIYKIFFFVSDINTNELIAYKINSDKQYSILTSDFIEEINKNEEVKFKLDFYSIIYNLIFFKNSIVLDTFKSIIHHKDISFIKEQSSRYLITNELDQSFDFKEFIKYIYFRIIENTDETYIIMYDELINKFIIQKDKLVFYEDIKSLCELLLFDLYDLIIDSEGLLKIERQYKIIKRKNEIKKSIIYIDIYRIIEEKDCIMTLEEIIKAIHEKFPLIKFDEISFRKILDCKRTISVIKAVSNDSFGLLKWEKKKPKIYKILNIILDYLILENKPVNYPDIIEHVLQNRPNSSINSALNVIRYNNKEKFKFFKNNRVGLANIYYPEEYIEEIPDKRNSHWNGKIIRRKKIELKLIDTTLL